MTVGKTYLVKPVFSIDKTAWLGPMKGTCVAVHPKGRFAVLEFEGYWGKVRECFWPEQVTERNRIGKRG